MSNWCLIPAKAEQFKKAFLSGEIDPVKLAGMSSKDRHTFLEKYVGKENATNVNSLFESKLLLKNQKKGMEAWARKVFNRKEIKRDLISKIEKMDKVLNPDNVFLSDLAETRLGVAVTREQATNIYKLSQKVQELKTKTDPTKSDIPLGRAQLDLIDYANSLVGKKANFLTNVAGVPRTLMSSLDLSAPFNQAWGLASRKQFYTNLGNMVRYAKNKENFRDLQASIITHPKYNLAKKSGLRLTDLGDNLSLREEQFMSTLLDRVPGIGASQRAYTGFLNKIRLDVFNDLINKAEVAGENVTVGSKASKDIANVVNNFSSGARVGKVESATPFLNAILFSPRKITSTLQMMNPRNYIDPKISKTARNAATRNLIGSLSLSAGVISAYAMLTGKKQEIDPRSSKFGKIQDGDTTIDVSGGNANYLTLLSRLRTGKIKNADGITKELSTKIGQTSAFDLISQFIRYKLSPNASFLVDAVAKENAVGEKKTVSESAIDRFKPMFANSVVELLKSDTDGKFGFALAGLLGAGLNTYSNDVDWNESEAKKLTQFKEKVGQQDFDSANKEFNTQYNEWFEKTSKNEDYQALSDEAKQALETKKKADLQDSIFKTYGFKYKEGKDNSPEKLQEKGTIKQLLNFKKTTDKLALNLVDTLIPPAYASEDETPKYTKSQRTFLEKIADLFTPLKSPLSNNVVQAKNLNNKPIKVVDDEIKMREDVIRRSENVIKSVPEKSQENLRQNLPNIVTYLEEEGMNDPKILAYALATIEHETTKAFKPVREGWYNDEKYKYPEGFTGKSEARKRKYSGGEEFYGRGLIQLTHDYNYKKYGEIIGEDLVKNPDKLLDPVISARVLSAYFKSRGTDKLIKENKIVEARGTINDDDKGEMVKTTYNKYLKLLTEG